MPQRTVTRESASIEAQGRGSITFFKPDESPNPSYTFKIYTAPGSVVDVPPLYHLEHDNVYCVERGQVLITVNGISKTYYASSGEVKIPRGTIHALQIEAPHDGPVILWQKTEPRDDAKELMLRVMNSILLDSPTYRRTGKPGLGDMLQLSLTFYNFDTYLAFLPTWTGKTGKLIDMVLDSALSWLASLLGYKPTYPEYVTHELYGAVYKDRKAL